MAVDFLQFPFSVQAIDYHSRYILNPKLLTQYLEESPRNKHKDHPFQDDDPLQKQWHIYTNLPFECQE